MAITDSKTAVSYFKELQAYMQTILFPYIVCET